MDKEQTYPHLATEWQTGAEFLSDVRAESGVTSFLVKAPAIPTPVGTILSLDLRFVDRDTSFHVHGRVLDHSADGARLAFLPEEKDRQELVLASAEGESIPYLRRRSVRTPCRLDVNVTFWDGSTATTTLSNISERGTHLEIDGLARDQRVELAIAFPDQRKRVRVAGRVTTAISGPQAGAGIEFLFGSSQERDDFATEVTRLRASQK